MFGVEGSRVGIFQYFLVGEGILYDGYYGVLRIQEGVCGVNDFNCSVCFEGQIFFILIFG